MDLRRQRIRRQGIRGFALVLALFAAPALFAQLDFDDFESYAVGSFIGGQGNWSIWDYNAATNPYGGPVDSLVVDTSAFAVNPGTQAMELEADDDVVRLFNGLNNGLFEFTADAYTPSVGAIGQNFFIFLNTYNHGGAKNWSAQICLNAGATTAFGIPPMSVGDLGGSTASIGIATPQPVVFDTWVELRLVVDIANNTYDAFYDGVLIMDDNHWRNPPAVPPAQPGLEMRCMDLYNNTGGVTFWFDNVFADVLGGCGTCCPFDQLTGVSDCGADTVTLDWTTFQPGATPYTGITINRDGVLLDTVGGADVTYTDTAPGNGVHTYELIAACPGGGSWNVSTALIHCSAIQNDTCATAIPANIGVPNPFDTTFAQVDPAMPVLSCGGSGAPDAFFVFTPPCDGDYTFDLFGSTYDTVMELFDLGPTPGVCASAVLLNCNDDAYGVATASRIDQPLLFASNDYLVRCTGFNNDVGPGTLTVGLMAVTNLISPTGYDCGSASVTLGWDGLAQGGPVYDNYDVIRNGVALATGLPAGTVTYTDTAPVAGANAYEVVGNSTACGLSSLSATITVAAPDLTATDVIFRGETASNIDSVAALEAALQAGGHTTTVIDGGPADAPCNMLQGAVVARLWYMGGTFPDDRIPTAADEAELVLAQTAGKGVYTESGDWWGFAGGPAAGWGGSDGVEDGTALDGNDTYLSMDGGNLGGVLDTSDLLGVAYNQDQTGNDWTDQIQPATIDALGPDSAVIWAQAGGAYNTGVFYNTNAGGKVISQSWEFGGFGGDQNDLAVRYVAALGGLPPLPQFRRGDSNIDGLFNIADPVFSLGVLFPSVTPPPSPQCQDSMDANDDGLLNIADPVAALGVLFPSTSPPPTLPAPFPACGSDPTTGDALDCVNFPPCP